MILFLRVVPYLAAAWLVAGYALALQQVDQLYWLFAGGALIGPMVGVWLLLRKATRPAGIQSVIFFIFLSLVSAIGALLFSEHVVLQWILIVALGALVSFFLEQMFRFAYIPSRYQSNALVNLSVVFALVSIFFAALTLYDLQLFASTRLWILVPAFAIVVAAWSWALTKLFEGERGVRRTWAWFIALIAIELFILILWLPPIPFVKAAFITIALTLAVQRFREGLSTLKPRRWPFVLLVLMLLLLVITTQWFV